jgi:hypothetical protein
VATPVYVLALCAFSFTKVVADALSVPFDFSRGVIGLDATIGGQPVYTMLDTGVDPSVIDSQFAEAHGLKIRGAGGEGSGFGDAKSAPAFPTIIDSLTIATRAFGPVDALTSDLNSLSNTYGRRLDAVLGYSFLKDTIALIDYPNRKLVLVDRREDATPTIANCRKHWNLALQTLSDDNWPIIPHFRFGASVGPVSLDTGSNGGIGLFPRALRLAGLRPALAAAGDVEHSGFRGKEKSKAYVLKESVGFGPFTLPAGQVVKLTKAAGASDRRVANVGNALFAAMNLKILLDYPGKSIRFYGDCGS